MLSQTSNHIHIQRLKVYFFTLVDICLLPSCFSISYCLLSKVCQFLFDTQVLDVYVINQAMSFFVFYQSFMNGIPYLCDKSD